MTKCAAPALGPLPTPSTATARLRLLENNRSAGGSGSRPRWTENLRAREHGILRAGIRQNPRGEILRCSSDILYTLLMRTLAYYGCGLPPSYLVTALCMYCTYAIRTSLPQASPRTPLPSPPLITKPNQNPILKQAPLHSQNKSLQSLWPLFSCRTNQTEASHQHRISKT